MPDASGFGDYEESGSGILALFEGEPCNFSVQMYLDDEPPITAGREIWGFPKKYGVPRLSVIKDTLTGTLHYDDERVAMGTMGYKPASLAERLDRGGRGHRQAQRQSQAHPRRRRHAEDRPAGRLQSQGHHVHGAWEGPARLHLIPHVNCRVADLPVRRIVGGRHQIVDFILPYGRVLHDYLA